MKKLELEAQIRDQDREFKRERKAHQPQVEIHRIELKAEHKKEARQLEAQIRIAELKLKTL